MEYTKEFGFYINVGVVMIGKSLELEYWTVT